MVLVDLQVKHKAFGNGTIVDTQGKYIKVKFDTVEKTFVYPDIFEKFLTLADGSISEDIARDLAESKDEKQRIVAKKNEENLRAMTKGIVIPGKEMALGDGDDEESKNNEVEEI